MSKTYYLYQSKKELNATGVHEIKIDLADLETAHRYTGIGWQIVGEIRSELTPGELDEGLTAALAERLMGAENSLDIIKQFIKDWSDKDMERKRRR